MKIVKIDRKDLQEGDLVLPICINNRVWDCDRNRQTLVVMRDVDIGDLTATKEKYDNILGSVWKSIDNSLYSPCIKIVSFDLNHYVAVDKAGWHASESKGDEKHIIDWLKKYAFSRATDKDFIS
jgi:hypothetical protein